MITAIKHILPKSLRSILARTYRDRKRQQIYERFASFTMIGRAAFCDNLALAERLGSVKGSVVECGVWKGGMSAGLSSILGLDRTYYLFDSFEGLPPAKDIDGDAAIQWQANKTSPIYFDNCTADESFAKRAMELAGVTRVKFVKGWFDKTLPGYLFDEPIALLRLDGDWYDSTMQCLDNLFDRVVPGGLILVDDYHAWDGCSRAVHDFLSKRAAPERIKNLNQLCYIERQSRPST